MVAMAMAYLARAARGRIGVRVKLQRLQSALRQLQRVLRPRHYRAPLATAYPCRMEQSPHVADSAPDKPFLTGYDVTHLVIYLRLLDADADGAAWQEVAQIVLDLDPEKEPERAQRVWASHLARAKWMTKEGYRHLLRS